MIREPAQLLSLAAGVAVAEVCGERALLKWPNDVLIDGRKVAGILVEGRPQERWAVLGIGINVALRIEHLPAELRDRAAHSVCTPAELEPTLERLQDAARALARRAPDGEVLEAVRARDALRGRRISWGDRSGVAPGSTRTGAWRWSWTAAVGSRSTPARFTSADFDPGRQLLADRDRQLALCLRPLALAAQHLLVERRHGERVGSGAADP